MDGNRNDTVHLDGWLANRLLDEALRVFGILLTSVLIEESEFDDELLERLRTTALDLLDDVARLTPLAAATPALLVPRDDQQPPLHDEAPLAYRAVEALASYTQDLAAVAVVYGSRSGPSAATFTQLAAIAEARIDNLGS